MPSSTARLTATPAPGSHGLGTGTTCPGILDSRCIPTAPWSSRGPWSRTWAATCVWPTMEYPPQPRGSSCCSSEVRAPEQDTYYMYQGFTVLYKNSIMFSIYCGIQGSLDKIYPKLQNFQTCSKFLNPFWNLNFLSSESLRASIEPVEERKREGETLYLSCSGFGYPTPSITWEKNGLPITSDQRIKIQGGSLRIINVALEDTGSYTCVVMNDEEKVEDNVSIQVTPFGKWNKKPTYYFRNIGIHVLFIVIFLQFIIKIFAIWSLKCGVLIL